MFTCSCIGALGRAIVILGPEKARTYAQYLIARQIAEDRKEINMNPLPSSIAASFVPSFHTNEFVEEISIDILVPDSAVAFLIGKGGATIISMRKKAKKERSR